MNAWRTGFGERLAPIYPEDARISMSEESPGIKLSPLLGNTRNTLIVSSEMKNVIQRHCTNEIEYLPFTLYDHRKRPYSRDYFIINPISTFDCLDFKTSTIKWTKRDPPKIIHISEHVLDREKVQNAPQLFRLDQDPMTYVIAYELAKEISDRRFANVYWTELSLS